MNTDTQLSATSATNTKIQYAHPPTISIVSVTPQMARQMFADWRFDGARKISKRTINCYKKQMVDGVWSDYTNMDVAEYAGKKYLLDGQHRLAAIAQMPDDYAVEIVLVTHNVASMANVEALRENIHDFIPRTHADIMYSMMHDQL